MVADVFEVNASVGDRLLLASDGLTGMLPDDFICDLLDVQRTPEEAAGKLVEAANRAGGYDNITVVIVDLDDTPARELAPSRGSSAAGRLHATRLLWVVAAIALVLVSGWGAYSYAHSRAYLIDESGYVAVYRGIPGSFAGLSLSWKVQTSDLVVARLGIPQRVRLQDGIPYSQLSQATEALESLRASVPSALTTLTPDATATAPPAP
jgi:protein phosphatase